MGRPKQFQRVLPDLLRLLRRLAPFLRRERPLLAGSVAAVFLEVIFRLLEPWPLKFIFDRLFSTEGRSYEPSFIAGLSPRGLIIGCALAVVAITGCRALAAYWNTVGFAIVGNRVMTRVREQLYRHLQCLSPSFHARARGGDLVVRVVGDVGMLRDVAVTAMLPLVANVLILAGMIAFMFLLHWELALLTLVTIPLFWLSTVRFTRRIRDAVHLQRKREGAMAATAGESIGAIRTVQALSLEGQFAESFAGQNKGSLREGVKASRLTAKLERSVDVLTAVATALVLWRGASLATRNPPELTPGELIVFLRYRQNAFRPVRDFAKYAARLSKATAAGQRVMEVLDREPEVKDLPGATPAPAFTGRVELENVSFEYEPGRKALRDVSLSIEPGQLVALVGPSGGGKSTIANLIPRLYDTTAGRVLIDGRDVRGMTLESLRSQVAVVLQDTLLFAASVRENIAYGAPDATDEQVVAAAKQANAHDFITRLPEEYETPVGERGVTMSGGQRQRIALARAAVRAAPLLILDEPTAGLDEDNARAVTAALEKLTRKRRSTTLLITHDVRLVSSADLIVYVDGGRIVERGTHAELLRARGRYAALWTLQQHSSGAAGAGERTPEAGDTAERGAVTTTQDRTGAQKESHVVAG